MLGRVHLQKAVVDRLAPFTSVIASTSLHTTSQRLMLEETSTKTLTVWDDLKEMRSSPFPALAVGFAGLIPFMAAPAYMVATQLYMPSVAFAQVVYGAVVLSFNGGIRMGITLPEESVIQPNWFNLGYGAASTVVATTGLLLPHPFSLITIITGLGVVAYFDMAMYGYPSWFKGLRFVTAFIAVLSLWTTLMCGLMLQRTPCVRTQKEAADKDSSDQ